MFFGGPVYPSVEQMQYQIPSRPSPWMDRAFDLMVQTFGNTGSAILLIALTAFGIYMKFGRKK